MVDIVVLTCGDQVHSRTTQSAQKRACTRSIQSFNFSAFLHIDIS